jgi:hypothetical protein
MGFEGPWPPPPPACRTAPWAAEAMLKHVAAQEMQQHGTFRFAKDLIPYKEINDIFEP